MKVLKALQLSCLSRGGAVEKVLNPWQYKEQRKQFQQKKKTSGQEVNVLSFVPQCCRRMLLDCGCGRFPSRHVDQSWECVFFHMSQEKKKALQIM